MTVNDAKNGFNARASEMLAKRAADRNLPSSILARLASGTDIAGANAEIVKDSTTGTSDPRHYFWWQREAMYAATVLQAYLKYKDSPSILYPGSKTFIENKFWQRYAVNSPWTGGMDPADYNPWIATTTGNNAATENHYANDIVQRYFTAKIFAEKGATYPDGHAARAWFNYMRAIMKTYFLEHAKYGWHEYVSTQYWKDRVPGYYAMAEFGLEPEKTLARMDLDYEWATYAEEMMVNSDQATAMRCGSSDRSYDRANRQNGHYSYVSFGLGRNDMGRGAWDCALEDVESTSSYRPPDVAIDMAVDRNKGAYETKKHFTTWQGSHLNGSDPGPIQSFDLYRYTYMTDDYGLGCSQLLGANCCWWQNYCWKLIFKSASRLPAGAKGETGELYTHLGTNTFSLGSWFNYIFQYKNFIVVKYINAHASSARQNGEFPADMDEVTGDGTWIFGRAGNTFVALRAIGGGLSLDGLKFSCTADNDMIILEAGNKSDYASFGTFQADIRKNSFLAGGSDWVQYTMCSGERVDVNWNRGHNDYARVNGTSMRSWMDSYKLYDSPFMTSTLGSGIIKIDKANHHLKLDFISGRRTEQ